MLFLGLRAYLKLLHIDLLLARGDFAALYSEVRKYPVGSPTESLGSEEVCHAVDMACIWYWKEVLCLQRSAVTTCLLRRCGVNALMIIGARQIPLKAHAWVEVNGRTVNDKPSMREIYAVLDKC